MPCDDKGRDWGTASPSQGHQRSPANQELPGERHGRVPCHGLQRGATPPAPRRQICRLQNREAITFCCLIKKKKKKKLTLGQILCLETHTLIFQTLPAPKGHRAWDRVSQTPGRPGSVRVRREALTLVCRADGEGGSWPSKRRHSRWHGPWRVASAGVWHLGVCLGAARLEAAGCRGPRRRAPLLTRFLLTSFPPAPKIPRPVPTAAGHQ